MPKTAALSSIRRSSRSPAPPSSSSDSRSPDATAYQLLANQLEKEEWRQLSNRKGGFALVKKGHSIDDAESRADGAHLGVQLTDDVNCKIGVNMSEENVEADDSCCASCGVAEVDDIKLTECSACDLVRYCSDACQEEHKSQHQQECKKWADEFQLRDEILFKQPESTHLGDCPICMIPMPLDFQKYVLSSCCSKRICNGCNCANQMREEEKKLHPSCPFCRKPLPFTKEQGDKQFLNRIAANDPVAMHLKGIQQHEKGDYRSAFEYYTRAAELGDADAQYELARLYQFGKGVEKDGGKALHHLEEAAIGGHPRARHTLGWIEWNSGNSTERAVKHYVIAAKLGDDDSIKVLMDAFRTGLVSKDDLASALRAHQAAIDATKSPQREAAEALQL